MEDKKQNINRVISKDTGISIGVSLLIGAAIFSSGILWSKVGNNEFRLSEVEAAVEIIPSRNEFDNLKEYFNQRFNTLENLLEKKN